MNGYNPITVEKMLKKKQEITNTSSITYYRKASTKIVNKIQKCKSNRIITRTKFKLKKSVKQFNKHSLTQKSQRICQITCSQTKFI